MEQPKWHEYMLTVLEILGDKKEHSRSDLIDEAAVKMNLSEELKADEISSGTPIYRNRCGWALTYLKQSGLIESPKRGKFKITNEGIAFLGTNPAKMGVEDLEKYVGYQDFVNRTKPSNDDKPGEVENDSLSPDEMIQKAENQYKEIACNELLAKVRSMGDKKFEKVVVQLLLAMGYGDKNDPKSGFVVGKAGDGGIDGVINQDKLGISKIYIQAKRYSETHKVSPHDVRDFAGALMSSESGNSRIGVFITTSDFTKEGREYAGNLDKSIRVILINGVELVGYMYQYGIGVTPFKNIVLNKVDNDFFEEE